MPSLQKKKLHIKLFALCILNQMLKNGIEIQFFFFLLPSSFKKNEKKKSLAIDQCGCKLNECNLNM